MAIPVTCPACSREINAADRHAGVVIKCPGCGGNVRVPADGPRIADAAAAMPVVPPIPVTPVVITDIRIPFERIVQLVLAVTVAIVIAQVLLAVVGTFLGLGVRAAVGGG